MSRLEELMAELCPKGVEYKTLGEIGTFIRGNGLQKKDFTESGVGCIHYGQLYTFYESFADETKSFVSEVLAKNLKKAKYGDNIFAITSENIEDVCKCLAWLGENEICIGGHSAIFSHNQNPKYITYCTQTESFFNQKRKIVSGTKVIEVSPAKLSLIKIPVPPLPIQDEIVRILDSFTELTTELTIELTKRKEQYQYLRQSLLDVNKKNLLTINDVCKFQNGFSFKSNLFKEDGEPILRITNIQNDRIVLDNLAYFDKNDYKEDLENFIVEDGDFVVAMSGATTGKIGLNKTGKRLFLNQRVGKFVPYESIINKSYLFHFLLSKSGEIYQMAGGSGAQPNLSSESIKKMKIPVPSLDEQARIVAILDRFDALCNDLTSGLPAEIEARKKQYEYYRDKLLTFKEAVQ